MEVNVNQRDKVRAEEIGVGVSFGAVNSNDYFMRIDLSKEVIFNNILSEDVVYAVNLSTGEVSLFDKNTIVEQADLKVEEIEKEVEPDPNVEVLEPREISEG